MTAILYGNLRAEIVGNAGARVQRGSAPGRPRPGCSPSANPMDRGNPWRPLQITRSRADR